MLLIRKNLKPTSHSFAYNKLQSLLFRVKTCYEMMEKDKELQKLRAKTVQQYYYKNESHHQLHRAAPADPQQQP